VIDLYVGVCEKVLILTSNGRNGVCEEHFGKLLSNVHHHVLCTRPVMGVGVQLYCCVYCYNSGINIYIIAN